MGGRRPNQLSRWEILGAWLRLWTPPREAVVPPVPWRKVAIGGGLVLAAAVVALVVLLNTESERTAAEQRAARAAAARHAAFLDSVERRQAPTRGAGPAEPESVPARRALLAAARASIATVAADRTPRTVRGVDCEPFPRRLDATPPTDDLARTAAAYDCLGVTARFSTGAIGVPFRLVVRFGRGRYAFCEIVPLGDRDRLSHPLPGACRL
jgi:hypothetical protein